MKLLRELLFEETKDIPHIQLIELARHKFIVPCYYFCGEGDEGDWIGDLALITDVPKSITKEQCRTLFKKAGCPDGWADEVVFGEWREYALDENDPHRYGPTLVTDMTFMEWVEQEMSYNKEGGDFDE